MSDLLDFAYTRTAISNAGVRRADSLDVRVSLTDCLYG